MKILVYGAGPLGTLFSARLQQGGQAVSLLARGQRLADLRQHGLVLEDALSGERTVTRVPLVEQLIENDMYDLIAVIMRKNRALEILPILAANRSTPNILFLMNNAAGPEALVQAAGKERVLIGFPASGGMYVEGHVVRYLGGTDKRKAVIPIGEVDGGTRERTRQIAAALQSMPGYQVEIRPDMDAWLKTHVAILFPSIAPAVYASQSDRHRLRRTRDLIVLTLRGMREGLQVLKALKIPITPSRIKIIERIPEPLLVLYLRAMLKNEAVDVALIGHANAARDEVRQLVGEFLELRNHSAIPTPAIDRLLLYLDPATPLMPDGSAQIRLRWW